MYRSDAAPAETPRNDRTWPAAEPVDHPWAATADPPALHQHFSPERATPASSSMGWIETGLLIMTLPIALTAGMMLAPMIWMFAPRQR